jgi:hypothetical protein
MMRSKWRTALGKIIDFEGIERVFDRLIPSREKTELRDQVVRLRSLVLELQTDLATVLREKAELQVRLRRLEEAFQPAGEVVYAESVYWDVCDGIRNGPYCPNCYDADRRMIRLNPGSEKGTYSCHIHDTTFRTAEYQPPDLKVLSAPGITSKMWGW